MTIHPSSFILQPSSFLNSVLFHLCGEGTGRDAEEIGGFVAGGGATQRLSDLDLLDSAHRAAGRVLQRSGEIERVAEPVVPAAAKAEILRLDARAIAQDRCTLDAVLQLADIAWPR